MLKVILMIDCNSCGEPFSRVSASTDRDPMEWKAQSQDLEYEAECSGWSFSRAAHHCAWCVKNSSVGEEE